MKYSPFRRYGKPPFFVALLVEPDASEKAWQGEKAQRTHSLVTDTMPSNDRIAIWPFSSAHLALIGKVPVICHFVLLVSGSVPS